VVFQNVHLSSAGDSAMTEAPTGAARGQVDTPEDSSKAPSTPSSADGVSPTTPVKIHPRRFAFDAQQARQNLGKAMDRFAGRNYAQAADCTEVPRDARALPATYKRAHAALVFRRPRGGSQVVELFVCGSTEPIRSTTLPVP
jgi:hypothetical protein